MAPVRIIQIESGEGSGELHEATEEDVIKAPVYTVVFDARNAGLPGWEAIVIGLLFIAIFYFSRDWSRRLSTALRRAGLIFACLWMVVVTLSTVGDTLRVRYRLNHGDYVVVEGVVSDFVPGDWGGHHSEQWRVRSGEEDHRYSYSRPVITPGFRQTQEEGGPIHDGVRVRIADEDGLIARLEVATSDLTP